MNITQFLNTEKTARPESKSRGEESTARAQWVGRDLFPNIFI